MDKILLDEGSALDYIERNISSCLSEKIEVIDDRFHHNTRYEDAISIIKNGILPAKELARLGICSNYDDILDIMVDIESHVNGSDSISLAVMGLTDLSPDEFEYNPFSDKLVDFLITGSIPARRVTTNYGNEYLSDRSICNDKFRSVDIRLLSLIQSIRKSTCEKGKKEDSIRQLINNYNRLREIACIMRDMKLNIPLREMSSNECTTIDIDKISSMPKVKIKS